MNIESRIRVVGTGLLIDRRILVYGDLHLGIEESLYTRDSGIPRTQFVKIKRTIKNALNKYKPKTVVLNGDVKHEFGKISREEWKDVLDIIDVIQEKAELVIIEGNHDRIMAPIARKKGLEVHNYYKHDNILITHGDAISKQKGDVIIIGHEHPAIELSEGNKKERYKCYIKGKYGKSELIVMPSMNTLTEGTDVLTGRLLSPYLKDVKDFHVYVVSDESLHPEILDFGKIQDLS